MVDRDLVAEERAAARQAVRPGDGRRSGMDAGTKRLALIAGGIGALLVAMVGGWSLVGHRPAGIPLIAPLPGPVRVKPADAGGMQLMAGEVAQTNGPAAQALAPGPEAAAPQALQAEVEAARKADAPAKPVVTVPTASAPAASAAAVPASPLPIAAPQAAPAAALPVTPPSEAAAEDAAPAAPLPAKTAPTATTTSPATGGRAVQLAAFDSEQAARAEWSRLVRRAPALLGDRTPVVAHITRNGRQFYRLRTGGFASIADATVFCTRAKALGIACTVADF